MFKIESYVTPILLSYVDKYVRDFKPADAQVSLWGGGVALHNLVLKADVLQQEVALPFTLVSGRIHELLIQVPWTKIMSEPIIVTIDTIECVLSLNPPAPSDGVPPPEPPSRKATVVEAPPGYMQALVRRIVSNIALRVHHLIVKYVQDDIVMSLNVKHLAVDSAGPNWEPAFADIDQNEPMIRRLVKLDDFTLCLDKADSDGKIRFFQEPLLYRCQLDLRVQTRLVSANTRRATSLNVQLRSTKLAWSVTNDQLALLLRLLRERPVPAAKPQPPAPRLSVAQTPLHSASSNSAEPTRQESWSEWAWSWLPTWMDRENGVQDAPVLATPLPVYFSAFLDEVSLVFKIMTHETNNRKRTRGILEAYAMYTAIKSSVCTPTTLRVRFGTRELVLRSYGRCVCGYKNYNCYNDDPTVYLNKIEDTEQPPETWKWPEECFSDKVETAEAVDETFRSSPQPQSGVPEGDPSNQGIIDTKQSEAILSARDHSEQGGDADELWAKMAPILYLEYTHDRSAPMPFINPYDNPPKDFQYSDWVEECSMTIKVQPLELRICMGLLHRLAALRNVYREQPPPVEIRPPMRTLTVEENEALSENLPQKRLRIDTSGIQIRIIPWDHIPSEKPVRPTVVLTLDIPKASIAINGPLYPHRVCAAACQMPDDTGPLWQGARLHVTVMLTGFRALISYPKQSIQRPCARADIKLVTHLLLNKDYFKNRDPVEFSYHLKIKELSISGSSARLQVAYNIPMSLYHENISILLKHTSLPKDALHDEDAVAIDFTVEDLAVRGYMSSNVRTHIITLQSAKATAFHAPTSGEVKQAWLFSAPDSPTTSPYLRMAVQWCKTPIPNSFDYLGIWAEPTAISIDPLLIAWLAYTPTVKPYSDTTAAGQTKSASATYLRRRSTPPSSSGRGVSRTSGADMVHVRSHGSSTEASEKREYRLPIQQKPNESWWSGERLVTLHGRMKSVLLNVEMGLVLVYVTMSTASAIDCATIRDAMERHASHHHRVLAISLGRLSVHSNILTKHLWHSLRHDGPTYVTDKPDTESFPWKIGLADVSCYTIELMDASSIPSYNRGGGNLKSTLKAAKQALPRTILELVTTSITVSMVTKSIQYKKISRKDTKKATSPSEPNKTRYFTGGMEFKPTTLKEFVRGPSGRGGKSNQDNPSSSQVPLINAMFAEEITITEGPVVSLGVHLHADTPPLIIRLEQEQLHVLAAAVHCFNHIHTLLKRNPVTSAQRGSISLGSSHKSLIRSVSEVEEAPRDSEDNTSEHSELIPLFERSAQAQRPLKTFLWFQWVVSRANLVVASRTVKLAFAVEDIISTIDIQERYNQFKVKLASASVKHYERTGSDDWIVGPMGGRVLEAREPTNAQEESHFLAVTITQAQISNLPDSWKEELHPKLLEQKNSEDSMWEIYATLAPLEAIIQPAIMDNVISLMNEMAPRSFCPLRNEVQYRLPVWQWPFCYVAAGGFRVIITGEAGTGHSHSKADDTFVFSIGKINVNPHPENPICRRAAKTITEAGWLAPSSGYEGRQYEIIVKNIAIRSSQFKQLIVAEESEEFQKVTANDNPALRWSTKRSISPTITPILFSVDICCVLAPALYMGGMLACGPAVELNLVTDCSIELSVAQLVLLKTLTSEFLAAKTYEGATGTSIDLGKHGMCPYATLLLQNQHVNYGTSSEESLAETTIEKPPDKSLNEAGHSVAGDSGVETIASSSKLKTGEEQPPCKKAVSVVFMEQTADTSEYLEIFVTMGVIDVVLYVADDSSPEVVALRVPQMPVKDPDELFDELSPECFENLATEDERSGLRRDSESHEGVRSLTDQVRKADIGQTLLDVPTISQQVKKFRGCVPLIHVILHQPNLYYWRRKTQKTLQISIFNAWACLGMGPIPELWHEVLLSTTIGVLDPVTDIPPALATLKVVAPIGSPYTGATGTSSRGTVTLDIEKPVQLELSTDRLTRLWRIYSLLEQNLKLKDIEYTNTAPPSSRFDLPLLYRLRNVMVREGMESISVQTSQLSVCGPEGTVGWDSASMQLSVSTRPDRISARALVTALLLSSGPPGDRRHVVMQPLMLGVELEAEWEAWRRAEGGVSAREPSVNIGIELDRLIFDFRPKELATCVRLHQATKKLHELLNEESSDDEAETKSESLGNTPRPSYMNLDGRFSRSSLQGADSITDHFYKDDLRSGAFKILSGGQLPMAYQVVLHGNAVAWRYPHPRAVTRIVAFPLPEQDEEIDCVLETYTTLLDRWQAHTYFKIPVGEPRELHIAVPPPETVFATTWRFRACCKSEPTQPPYEFSYKKFASKPDRTEPLNTENQHDSRSTPRSDTVTAEQLSGVLRVDSYFAPSLLPRVKFIVRLSQLQLHIHNAPPCSFDQSNYLEGYYVSKPLMRSHRVLSIAAKNSTVHAHIGSPAGPLFVLDADLSADILDCATGTIEELVDHFRLQGALSNNKLQQLGWRTRLVSSGIQLSLHVPRIRTLHALVTDWRDAYDQYVLDKPSKCIAIETESHYKSRREIVEETAAALEGRVTLWIHNSCASALRVGQENTDEVVPLGPGARLAYRWRCPTAPKRLRLALAGPTTDWRWSNSIPFVAGTTRLRIEDAELNESKQFSANGAFVHVKIEETGARRCMHLSGRLVLANMLRYNLLYKVRSHAAEGTRWRTVCSGELSCETVGRSVICSVEGEMVLKIKIATQETGWSGDIPLKECPKENVPWLVKVPSECDINYVSVWCRVVRGRSDGRILATIWPLYVLHSHLPLDTDVLIVTEPTLTAEETPPQQLHPPPMLQCTPGRGTSTHLRVPGTTSARHSLTFQYRNIECPVTREAVPLHYGVTDVSVFEKRTPVANIEDVVKDLLRWLNRSGRNSKTGWPYSLVTRHWGANWQPAVLQPRCDVTVRYQAVRAGGGCCLEIQLCPVALLCNATPIPLTLRAHDAAPLCRLEAGCAISPPSPILTKPFFMSVELGRETFVSDQLQVSPEDPGRYGAPPPGHVALEHATEFSILCNQKVALLTLYYEIKEQINILGVTSTYVLINRLKLDLLVSASAVPDDASEGIHLRPKTFKMVQPTAEGSMYGTPLCRFWLHGRWRGGPPSELRMFLSLALPEGAASTRSALPIRLGKPPVRRAMALIDKKGTSIPVVVTQMKHEHRWLIVVAPDPCPQFVIHNHTRLPFAVAQPVNFADEPSTSHIEAAKECLGATWWCVIQPETAIHYSTPAHCSRYPPTSPPPLSVPSNAMPFLTFAMTKGEGILEWCAPVAIADGEQLLQFSGSVTIKMRVRTHPHSTLLELQDVDQNDISASDIRRRLDGALETNKAYYNATKYWAASDRNAEEARLARVNANEKILGKSDVDIQATEISKSPSMSHRTSTTRRSTTARTSVTQRTSMAQIRTAKSRSVQDNDGHGRPRKKSESDVVPLEQTPGLGTSSLHSLDIQSKKDHAAEEMYVSDASLEQSLSQHDNDMSDMESSWSETERVRCLISGIAVEMGASAEVCPLLALHLDRTAILVLTDAKRTKIILSVADAQIDNLQYESGQFDFAVVATTRSEALAADRWPPLWNMFAEHDMFASKQEDARILLKLEQDKWNVVNTTYRELTEVEISLGTLALYVEDAYVKALVDLSRLALPSTSHHDSVALSEERSLRRPLRLRQLHVHPLDLTLTLHTAVRMYIALDQSPLRLSAFKLHDMMTSAERLTHALTVHYLSAAILGAGWVVGGLELLGAPGALAARLGGATGGVRGVASAAAAALLRSLIAWAGSLARNLDLLAGDEEHARRAAAARRRPPPSFVAGLMTGITNFAINILGAVGGLAHHPLVGVAVGESESGATALRRGLLGALTKPLSATADLVAYAGTGLLRQTGWDPLPVRRRAWVPPAVRSSAGWQRDCVRWMFRLCELDALAGFEVLLDNTQLQLLLTHKLLVVADPETERIVEMIDLRFCTLKPYEGQIIELCVIQKRQSKASERAVDEDDEFQISAAAMARVARYTGAEGSSHTEMRVLSLLPPPGRSHSLHAALAAALHHNSNTHFPML